MPRRKFRRKDLKRPDEFVSHGRDAIEWSVVHRTTLAWIGGTLAVLALLVAGAGAVRSARVTQANADLAQGLAGYEAGRYPQAATQFAEVASRWPSTTIGTIAELLAASADVRAGNLGAAAPRLQEASSADQAVFLRQQALLGQAVLAERAGDMAPAAARYGDAANVSGPYTALALLGEARCRERLGEKDKAREVYERIGREYGQVPEIEIVRARIEALKPS
jgi:hypothetical protein